MPLPPDADILILGGGLAGAAAATMLARAGRQVILIEREPTPRHKVCGEFLSTEALGLLEQCGLHLAAHGAVPIHKVRLCARTFFTAAALPASKATLSP